jgi:uncharacterized membrane protein
MMSQILPWSELPNAHPALVHFAIAFVPLALALDAAGLLARGQLWLDRAAATVWGAAGLAALLAQQSGERAGDSLSVPMALLPDLNTHSDWGHYVLYAALPFAVLRVALSVWDRTARRRWARTVSVIAGAAVLLAIGHTAHLGGQLVYGHGLAVVVGVDAGGGEAVAQRAADSDTTSPDVVDDPLKRLTRSEGGEILWRPQPGDVGALGSVLVPATGASLDQVGVEPAAAGLGLRVAGRTILLFEPELGDVEVAAVLELGDFAGTVGVVHHASDARNAGALTVSSDGVWQLLTLRGDREPKILDRKQRALAAGERLELAVSAVGRHLRGTEGGELVVHGHEDALPNGGVGLLLDGNGSLVVHEIRVTPGAH